MPYLAGTTSSPTWSPLVEPRLLLSSTAAPTAARDAHQSRVAWHAPHPLLPSVRGCEWGSNPLGGSLYSLLNKPIQRWTGARAGEVSEAAAVKARWLGNFCPRQPVYRALKRQRSSRTSIPQKSGNLPQKSGTYTRKIRKFFCFERLLDCSSSSTYVHISERSYPFGCTTGSPPPPEYNFYRGRRIAGPGRPAKKSRN